MMHVIYTILTFKLDKMYQYFQMFMIFHELLKSFVFKNEQNLIVLNCYPIVQ